MKRTTDKNYHNSLKSKQKTWTITTEKIVLMILKLLTKKTPSPADFTGKL